MFEEASADQNHFDRRMLNQFNGDSWAVGDDREAQLAGKMPREFACCGATIENNHLTGLDHACGGASNFDFALRSEMFAASEVYNSRRSR